MIDLLGRYTTFLRKKCIVLDKTSQKACEKWEKEV